MAVVNKDIASIIFLFFILSTGVSSQGGPATPTDSAATEKCPADYINNHMIGLSEKTKEFLKEDIIKRLGDNSIKGPDRECLNRFFNSYQAALGVIERAIDDFSVKRYTEASNSLQAYAKSVDDSLKCSPDTAVISTDYTDMQRWAQFTAQDIVDKIKGCIA